MTGNERSVGFDYAWPGNNRDLEQCVRNLLIQASNVPAAAPDDPYGLDALFRKMRTASVDLDEVASAYTGWFYRREGSYTRTGALLGIDRRTVASHVGDAERPAKASKRWLFRPRGHNEGPRTGMKNRGRCLSRRQQCGCSRPRGG
mgnify:CR=1 FL=1